MASSPTQSWIQRHECKYLVSETVARSVRASVAPFVTPDAYAARRPDHAYPIVSLYLDSDTLALSRETVEGQLERFKLRIRSYTDDPAARVFLEVKRRHNAIISKDRCGILRHDATRMLLDRGSIGEAPLASAAQRRAYTEFARLMLQIDARPTLLVRYEREAYVGLYDAEVRVTFDRKISAIRMPRPEIRLAGSDFSVVESNLVVVELKFNNRCPEWLDAIVRNHGLRRRSYSKYARSLASVLGRGFASTA